MFPIVLSASCPLIVASVPSAWINIYCSMGHLIRSLDCVDGQEKGGGGGVPRDIPISAYYDKCDDMIELLEIWNLCEIFGKLNAFVASSTALGRAEGRNRLCFWAGERKQQPVNLRYKVKEVDGTQCRVLFPRPLPPNTSSILAANAFPQRQHQV